MDNIFRIESVSTLHDIIKQPPPKHPLVSIIDFSNLVQESVASTNNVKVSSALYGITLKKLKKGVLKYGRNQLDFQEGSLFFSLPNQVGMLENAVFAECEYNWGLFFHPDLIHGTSLSSKISKYSFFNYSVNEALHLSEDEKKMLGNLVNSIKEELYHPIDKHTKSVLVAGIELLLNHCMRYYDRQFVTREKQNKYVVESISNYLHEYFSSELPINGLPTAQDCAAHVNLSPNYLSDLLRKETGKTTQEHIHYYLLEVAKNRLLGTNESVKLIAHSLGFEYPHYFSSLFKKKMGVSPSEFRVLNK